MHNVIKWLCEIVFDPAHGIDHGIYKGRNFGTMGEQYAAFTLKNTILNETTNLTSNTFIERIGNDSLLSPYKMHLLNNNLEILGYGLAFRNTTSGPPNATIPLNETFPRTINIGDQLALDRIFNGRVKASDLKHGVGTYRVYTAFRDPTGTILKTETVSGGGVGSAELKAWWQFSKI
jgi:hypothetical protein